MRRDLPLILLEKKDWPSDATKAIYHEIIISQNKRSIKITKKKKGDRDQDVSFTTRTEKFRYPGRQNKS